MTRSRHPSKMVFVSILIPTTAFAPTSAAFCLGSVTIRLLAKYYIDVVSTLKHNKLAKALKIRKPPDKFRVKKFGPKIHICINFLAELKRK